MIQFDDRGLITAVVQDSESKAILMVAHMNREALARTLSGPHVWFYSRSRGELWEKGATSGNYLNTVDVSLDCDGDALLVTAVPEGAACHTGAVSCFHNVIKNEEEPVHHHVEPGVICDCNYFAHEFAVDEEESVNRVDPGVANERSVFVNVEEEYVNRVGPGVMQLLAEVIHERAVTMPEGSYTADLLRQGVSRIAQKLIEEAGETGLAAATGSLDEVAPEMSDLLYNCVVLLESTGVSIDDVWAELAKRRGASSVG